MKSSAFLLMALLAVALTGCGRRVDPATEKDLNTPVVPDGFNEQMVETLKCPWSQSKLRLATKRDLAKINDRIGALKMKTVDHEQRISFIDAALIGENGKYAYRIDGVMPVLKPGEALVLDDKEEKQKK